jgi:hypothetical protein
LSKELALVTGRRTNPIGLAFMLRRRDNGTLASVDLLNHNNQILQRR